MSNESASELLNPMARRIFTIALRDDRAGELLAHLFDGGGVTVDGLTRELVLIPALLIQEVAENS